MKETKQSNRTTKIAVDSALSLTHPTTLTTAPPTPPGSFHKRTKFIPPKKVKENGYKRKRVNFDNQSKRKKKRPSHHTKTLPWSSQPEASTGASDNKTLQVDFETPDSDLVTHCSAEECVRSKACWRDVKGSRKCQCDEVACGGGWELSVHAGNEDNKDIKGGSH